jgi:hypothetical protein
VGQVVSITGASGHRLWRLRKLHQYVDAEIAGGTARGELTAIRFLFNGELSYERRVPSRDAALAEAASKRAELEREGWAFHW